MTRRHHPLLIQPPDMPTTATFRTRGSDSGCSFCLYIPVTHPLSRQRRGDPKPPPGTDHRAESLIRSGHASSHGSSPRPDGPAFPLMILIHSSDNNGQRLRDEWSEWAEEHQVVLLSVLFPYPIANGCIDERWKSLVSQLEGGRVVRFDLEILEMVNMVEREWGWVRTDRFGLAGFSGGAQVAQRFWLLHCERVSVLSIAAPGAVTRLSSTPWPHGVCDTMSLFHEVVSRERLQNAKTLIQCVIGSHDVPVRHAVMAGFEDDLLSVRVAPVMEEVYGAGHEEGPIRVVQQAFFAMHLAGNTTA